jgi:hypothetical protein
MSVEASGSPTLYTASGNPPRIDELVYADSQLRRSIADNPPTASLIVYASNPVHSIARLRGNAKPHLLQSEVQSPTMGMFQRMSVVFGVKMLPLGPQSLADVAHTITDTRLSAQNQGQRCLPLLLLLCNNKKQNI